ncbi:UDP-glucose 4-epimerase [Litorimonas taeanensis]|uniref:UDP-glucose 4-epimerase n=1 Tax=Litorimonas taeanensis TaxID=568099 RepID=A0A420WDK6_9PROT|nr:polysaccharide biosynthesis protein [Litorimonas taeanensis]RKQ69091.1 UDP-glucose 4-epimerase [Litorimonas taeanensis]
MFKDKTLLITGGTGSFGNAVLRRFLSSDVGEIRIFSRDEKKQDDMRKHYNNEKLVFHIGDVRDYDSVDRVMQGVDFVFHAAALKQVPSCEFFPMEAIRTNELGANNVMTAAARNGVERVVVLSTDKAVYPINAMGLSKAMMEKLMVANARTYAKQGTTFCATRYGNVMASRGSVIPLFLDQIKSGQDLTITDPAMTRYLMTLDESVELVLFAFHNAQPGDIFVQKSPASTIADLAQAMMEMFKGSGKIKYIGTRHGEKLYETLVSREEMAKAEEFDRYYRVPADNRGLNYDRFFSDGDETVAAHDDYNSHNTERLDIEGVKKTLMKLELIREALK